MSHSSGNPESGSLKRVLEGQAARQKAHSSCSFPSMMYFSLLLHSALEYSPAYTGRYTSLNGSSMTRMRDLAGLLLLYCGLGAKVSSGSCFVNAGRAGPRPACRRPIVFLILAIF